MSTVTCTRLTKGTYVSQSYVELPYTMCLQQRGGDFKVQVKLTGRSSGIERAGLVGYGQSVLDNSSTFWVTEDEYYKFKTDVLGKTDAFGNGVQWAVYNGYGELVTIPGTWKTEIIRGVRRLRKSTRNRTSKRTSRKTRHARRYTNLRSHK